MHNRFMLAIILVLAPCAPASTAVAQLVTNSDYRLHTPTAVIYKVTPTDQRIFLHVVTPNGIAQQGWNLTTHPQRWSPWTYGGNQTGDPPSEWQNGNNGGPLPFLTWTGTDGRARLNGFFSYSNTLQVGMPFWEHGFYKWDTMPAPLTTMYDGYLNYYGFTPITGFSWHDGHAERLNIFGFAEGAGGRTVPISGSYALVELWWNGQKWNWTTHGEPEFERKMILGLNGSLWDSDNRRGYVFLATNRRYYYGADYRFWDGTDIRYRFYDDQQCPWWCWRQMDGPDLGYGAEVTALKRPLAIGHTEDQTYKIYLFVVARVERSQPGSTPTSQWEMLERIWDGANWSDWISHGRIPDTHIDYYAGYDEGVEMTSGVVWRSGNTLRLNLFGYNDVDGRLREFHFDGTRWQWGLNVSPPSGLYFRTDSSVAVDVPGQDRISVFGRDDAGEVWELYWDTAQAPVQWRWQQH